jgi:hypothetical protein
MYAGATMASKFQTTLKQKLRQLALTKTKREGVSYGEHVKALMAGSEAKPSVSEIFDLFTSEEPTNIALHKDRMLAEAIEFDMRRK